MARWLEHTTKTPRFNNRAKLRNPTNKEPREAVCGIGVNTQCKSEYYTV